MTKTTAPASIDQPFTLPNGTVLKNRLAKAALSEQLGDLDNAPTSKLDRLYRQWSEGGFGLILTGNVMVDRRALGEPRNVVVEDSRDLPALRSWAAAARSGGSAAWVQLNHPGRQSPRYLSPRPVAPSPVDLKLFGQFASPRALTSDEIHEIIERFATTAETVVRAGFDGVQIHSAHGYLSSQFLSPITNQRTDEWGGDPERRMRFLLEIVRAVRKRIGHDAGLGVKLNSADFQRGGFSEEESMGVVEALSAERLDLLEISGGTYEHAALLGSTTSLRESTRKREAYFLEYAEQVRERAAMPLMLTGGLRSAKAMNEALAGGAIDLIGLGRPACLDAAVAQHLLDGTIERAATAPKPNLPFRALQDYSELGWHTTQMWRLGTGKPARPSRHHALTVSEYTGGSLLGGLVRQFKRPPRY
ncbi:MAG: NADH:flavin oxidoreductase/NADH oxidase family protein [Solirubrobacteraceae bacterium]|nr:NADH:flavin oxidoreductase/NADH oxidase family protein [Solirubrobacteraceae bacterium]